ncbi:hypothetical protein [Fervidibacillus halotolerans]
MIAFASLILSILSFTNKK